MQREVALASSDGAEAGPTAGGHRAGWWLGATGFVSGVVTVVSAVVSDWPGSLIAPGLSIVCCCAAYLVWFWRLPDQRERLEQAVHVPWVVVVGAVGLAAVSAVGAHQWWGQGGAPTAAKVTSGPGSTGPSPSAETSEAPSLSSAGTAGAPPTPPASAPGPSVVSDRPPANRVVLADDAYFDFDKRRPSLKATPDAEVLVSQGRLAFGTNSRGAWDRTSVLVIPTSAASRQGCEQATDLRVSILNLRLLKQDESVCVSTSEGQWAVLRVVPSQSSGDSLEVEVRLF